MCAAFNRNRTHFGELWAGFGQIRAGFGQSRAGMGRISDELDKNWTEFDPIWSHLGQIWPISTKLIVTRDMHATELPEGSLRSMASAGVTRHECRGRVTP